jgi:hypothetical protein
MINKKLLFLLVLNLVSLSVISQKIIKINRDPDNRKDYANVFFKTQYTLFDLWSDEPIFPDENKIYHIYYATNENKTPKEFNGTAYELSTYVAYKFINYENCKNWCDGVTYIKKHIKLSEPELVSNSYSKNNVTEQQKGCISGNCANGYGKSIDEDGNIYEGNFVNNSFQGNGKFITAKGNKYEGNWVKGSPNGYGVLSTSAGKLVGNWSGLEYLDGYMISPSGNTVSQGIYIDQKLAHSSNTNSKKGIVKSTNSGNKKTPITRKCECCGIGFTIKNGWGYSDSISQSIYQFGSPEEIATEYLTAEIVKSMGVAYDEYHPTIKYHSKKCAYDCGN